MGIKSLRPFIIVAGRGLGRGESRDINFGLLLENGKWKIETKMIKNFSKIMFHIKIVDSPRCANQHKHLFLNPVEDWGMTRGYLDTPRNFFSLQSGISCTNERWNGKLLFPNWKKTLYPGDFLLSMCWPSGPLGSYSPHGSKHTRKPFQNHSELFFYPMALAWPVLAWHT